MAKSLIEKLMIIGHCIRENLNEIEHEREEFELKRKKEIEEQNENQKKIFDTMIIQAKVILKEAKIDSDAKFDTEYKHPIFSYIKVLGLLIETKYITRTAYFREQKDTTSPNYNVFFRLVLILLMINGLKTL